MNQYVQESVCKIDTCEVIVLSDEGANLLQRLHFEVAPRNVLVQGTKVEDRSEISGLLGNSAEAGTKAK